MAFLGVFGRKKHERAGFQLYTSAVQAARDPWFYGPGGVPDTMDGRFDMVGLFVFLVIHRLRDDGETGKALAQAVFDAMFSDMDFSLREIGVGDMTVGKKVKAMWEAFHGRAAAYEVAVVAHDQEGLTVSIARNVWRGEPAMAEARVLAAIAMQQTEHLAGQALEALVAGRIEFLPVPALA